KVKHDTSHARDLSRLKIPAEDDRIGREWAREFRRKKAILGVFDEGCMGMFNAIIPDDLLHETGCFKERLSQSTLYAAMRDVSDAEPRTVCDWYKERGLKLRLGSDEATELTEKQVLEQCKMYIAALRL